MIKFHIGKSRRRKLFEKISAFILIPVMIFVLLAPLGASAAEFSGELDCKSAILIEASTGRVLYEKNADEALPPASVTKIMTVLLVCEALDAGTVSLTDYVPVSEYAAGMGGSQIYLKVGEDMTLRDMLKSVIVASANDCAVALAEYIAGSEESFVAAMNSRAKELGMNSTNFENISGLDDDTVNHVTSARDIATMSSELLKHKYILEYTPIWMDTVRDGAFGLTNTNRLIRFYNGANGLKTGSTSKARFCISATAERGGMQLIAVIMAAPTRDVRNECAKKLLDFGFANYGVYTAEPASLSEIGLKGALSDSISVSHGSFSALLGKSDIGNVKYTVQLPEYVCAPLSKGDAVGKIEFTLGDSSIGSVDIVVDEDAPRVTFSQLFVGLIKNFLFIFR